MVRCGIGSDDPVNIAVWVRRGENEPSSLLYTSAVTIPQAWHNDDNVVTYYVMGTNGSNVPGQVTAIESDLAEGMFPGGNARPSHISPDYPPNTRLLELLNYSNAAGAWNNVHGGANIRQVNIKSGSDVEIYGYWNPKRYNPANNHPNHPDSYDGVCGQSVACVQFKGAYPHLGEGQSSGRVFYIEDPPRPGIMPPKTWTINFKNIQSDPDIFIYLPSTLMHEFGHTLGLWEGEQNETIMQGRQRELEPCVAGTHAGNTCGLADDDKNGAKAIYGHHLAH